ncbi:alpha-hydroxy acid oxidase [Aureimonas phyllosphaerae]|uniref:Isopentenyl diphosphate isomerase/L-lactate dehydrogenase-like FMN-dependent dehydrogenase n=1 Tax=Aureimonas phyllosphaerae TaxID=1166078 RepID=A0A7W6BQ69_9HYPH|nr:alpha-hydroxy acid oxidase [Aureimonas phyllosphaerae]MBB3934250.1 isopentenyl diphosphate isomerase/L-lactate dehydrogenase-like FMN-dependent dehydrogenase [Aureimonas phyllosphaerae]MBB3958534.1 isopentenyl diphosphate isomerase/L-lactate dehydrogenase-like FMN-dependent dehydrogenase [Aureimonas phyllosphaerae]SFE98470.1 FMN-dependent dehydrogenase, includes L-lactate dehydrogenase and type II isopentenyl diphosphate isomerase [Aureimonas phyllosphaerae]
MTARFVNVEDARRIARRRLPKIFFDYIDGGSSAEATLASSTGDFANLRLEQRVLAGLRPRDLSSEFLGQRNRLPFMLGPVGFLGLFAGHGEILAAKAAHAAGIPACLSNFSIASLDDLRRAGCDGPLQFQLYVLKDRGLAEEFVAAAERAGVETLHLTVDTAVTGIRERDARNGFRAATRITPRMGFGMALRPAWAFDMLRTGKPGVGAVRGRAEFGANILAQAATLSRLIDPALSWDDVDWLRGRWRGRLSIKGILHPGDARRAKAAGADAIVVSNHGGRQLDGARSTISALPSIVDAADGLEVLLDGGVRRGTDIVKAIALGASGVLLGRAYVWGVAAGGEAGAARVIQLLSDEIDVTLGLMGLSSIDELKALGRDALVPPSEVAASARMVQPVGL